MDVSEAYDLALAVCRQASDNDKKYVAIQRHKVDGFRLVATNCPTGQSCYSFGMGAIDWASNVLYRLARVGPVDFTSDNVDEYFDWLETTGYGRIQDLVEATR